MNIDDLMREVEKKYETHREKTIFTFMTSLSKEEQLRVMLAQGVAASYLEHHKELRKRLTELMIDGDKVQFLRLLEKAAEVVIAIISKRKPE